MKDRVIRNIPLFSNLPEPEIEYLARHLTELEVPAGTVIFREGEPGEYLLVVLAGELDIVKEIDTPDERIVATRREGDHIGEMSMISPGGTRSASVRVRSDATLLQMTRTEFDELLHRQPRLGYAMSAALSQRLDASHNRAMHELIEINHELVRAYEELKAAHEQIVEKEKLEKELEVARQIQMSILPDKMPSVPGFDFSAVMIPARAVGGDLFDFVRIDKAHIGLAIADVTDKGVPAAMFMALTRSLLRAEALRSADPAKVLQRVNRVLIEMNREDMFVTMLYGVLDLENLGFSYARAGHPAPMVVRDKKKLIEPTNGPCRPLALFTPMILDVQKIQLERGDTLLLYTDGVTDAADKENHEFGTERLRQAMLDVCARVERPACSDFVQLIDEYRGSAPHTDDLTMVLLNAL
jgi:sigma-B regulation protein RsbU (phosphoserine phosphatase)